MRTDGLILAAGAGRRRGLPKALVPGALHGAVDALAVGGCTRVTVVLGAQAERALPLVPRGAQVIVAADWAAGMSASLRAGLSTTAGDAVLVHLVDLPDVGPAVIRRILTLAAPDALARAVYGGRPGHPVLLGRDHIATASTIAAGDRGARDYLASAAVTLIECGDLATGRDVDFAE